jgi:hypothetical protein
MGKLKGILPIEGSVGRVTFAKTIDGIVVREKTGVSRERILTEPQFQRTRENMFEFGNAGSAAAMVLQVMRSSIFKATDQRVMSRLLTQTFQVLKTDPVNPRGQRTVADGDLGLLNKFEFNVNSKLPSVFFGAYGSSIDRVAGELEVTVPAFVPANLVKPLEGATHIRLVAAASELNFIDFEGTANGQTSGYLPLNTTPTAPLTLTCTLTPNSTLPLFLAFGSEYHQEVNGVQYPFKNGDFNAFRIVKVDA